MKNFYKIPIPLNLLFFFLLGNIYAQKEINVKGMINDEQNKPISGARILLMDQNQGNLATLQSDNSGAFEKSVEVNATPPIVIVATVLKTDYKTYISYEVALSNEVNFAISMKKGVNIPVTVTGRIVDKSNSPIADVQLKLIHSSIATSPEEIITNKNDGTFEYKTEMDTSLIFEQSGVQYWPFIFLTAQKSGFKTEYDTIEVKGGNTFDVGDISLDKPNAIKHMLQSFTPITLLKNKKIQLYSLDGKLLFEGLGNNMSKQNFYPTNNGIYIIKVFTKNNQKSLVYKNLIFLK